MIISPCISICKIDPSTGYCYSCARTNEEKNLGNFKIQLMNGKKITSKKLKKDLVDGN